MKYYLKRLLKPVDRILTRTISYKLAIGIIPFLALITILSVSLLAISYDKTIFPQSNSDLIILRDVMVGAVTCIILFVIVCVRRLTLPEMPPEPFRRSRREPRIRKAPGTQLLKIVDFLFRPSTVKLTFEPLISDWQFEYFEALNQRRTIKARWINIRYRFAFACTFIRAMGLSRVFSLFKQISK